MSNNGTDVVVTIEDPGTPGTFRVLGSQRDATLNESTDPIDVSSKAAREGEYIPGRYSGTLDCDALYVPSDAAYGDLRDAMRNGTKLNLQISHSTEPETQEIAAVITSLSSSFPDQAEALVSASFQLSGAFTVT